MNNALQLFTLRNKHGQFQIYVDDFRKINKVLASFEDIDIVEWQWAWSILDPEEIEEYLLGNIVKVTSYEIKYKRWTVWMDKNNTFRLSHIPEAIHDKDFEETISKLLKKPIKKISTIYKMFML